MDNIIQFGGQYWPYLIGLGILAMVLINGWTWWKERRT
jgi:hypothetical protein